MTPGTAAGSLTRVGSVRRDLANRLETASCLLAVNGAPDSPGLGLPALVMGLFIDVLVAMREETVQRRQRGRRGSRRKHRVSASASEVTLQTSMDGATWTTFDVYPQTS